MAASTAPAVLIVDDDPTTRLLVRRGLEACELELGGLHEAADGVEAQGLLERESIALVITDLRMPNLDGLGLIRWGRTATPGTAWIILSGVETFDAAVEAIQLGAYDFLGKPPRMEELEVVVRNVLEQRQLVAERDRLFDELRDANLDLARKIRELQDKSDVIRRDLERAEVIQRALLPSEPPSLEGYRVNAIYRPGMHVGGDLYYAGRIGPKHLAMYVTDATGHGVSSAMLSVLFHRRLTMSDRRGVPLSPADVLDHANRAICEERIAPGLFLTVAYCLVDLEERTAVIASAGHPPVLIGSPATSLRRVARTGPALGLSPGARYGEERIWLAPGERLLLYTDGVLGDDAGAGTRRLEQTVRAATDDPMQLLDDTVRELAAGDDAVDRDDVTIALFEAKPGVSRFDNRAGAPRTPAPDPRPANGSSGGAPVTLGEGPERMYMQLRGRGTWTACDAFHDTACGAFELGRPLVVDLGECEYLDSTFLGTIHQLVNESRGTVELQNVPKPLLQAFEELSMAKVLETVRSEPLRLPPMRPLSPGAEVDAGRARVLEAHEALMRLSVRNREKFSKVVEMLRAQ